MKPFFLRYNSVSLILFVSCLLFSQITFAQTVDDLAAEIESHEQQMTVLEKQITRNSTSGNTYGNAALEQKIKEHNDEIKILLSKIEQIKSGAAGNSDQLKLIALEKKLQEKEEVVEKLENEIGTLNKEVQRLMAQAKNSDELELVAVQKELQVTEGIIEDLENEIGTLNKEIQRLTVQGGGSAEIEKLQNKIEKLQNDNQILKQQIVGYRKNTTSNTSSKSNSGTSAQVTKLEGQIKLLKTKNRQLRVQANNTGTRNLLHNKHFLKQYRSINTTNWVLGGRYTILPNITFKKSASLLQGTKKVGTILPISDLSAIGYYGFMGLEFLFHGRHVGCNIGLTVNYAYNEGTDIKMHTPYVQLSGELTILPIRLGLKIGVNGGYTFGQILNHEALLNDNSIQADPEFSTFMVGFDTKARFYLSRYIAFAGYFGADYALSDELKADSWHTRFRYGIGIDFIIPLKKT